MNEAMKKLRAEAEKVMRKELTFATKEEALKEAFKQLSKKDSLISLWKAPDSLGGKSTVVQHENREEACICEYTEILDTNALYDEYREKYDTIKEV